MSSVSDYPKSNGTDTKINGSWPILCSLKSAGSETFDTSDILQGSITNDVLRAKIRTCRASEDMQEIWKRDRNEQWGAKYPTYGSVYSHPLCESESPGSSATSHPITRLIHHIKLLWVMHLRTH